MNKLFLFAFFLLVTTINLNAQNIDSYVDFTSEQIVTAKKITIEKIAIETEFSFSKGVEYQEHNFWFITTAAEKKYYFKSTKTFTEVIYIEEDYRSLMEYIFEENDF